MTFANFQKQVTRTLPNLHKKYVLTDVFYPEGTSMLPVHLLDLIHMRLGIVSEQSELLHGLQVKDKVNIGEELGDVLWYIANDLTICKKIGFISEEVYNKFASRSFADYQYDVTDGGIHTGESPAWFPAVVFNAAELADQAKKWLAYGKFPKVDDYIKHMNYLINAVGNLALSQEINLEVYMENVINKLKVRYPDKFEESKAINRDTQAERKELEK